MVALHILWRRIVHSFFDALIFVYRQLVVASLGIVMNNYIMSIHAIKAMDETFCDGEFVAIHKLGVVLEDSNASGGFEFCLMSGDT